MNSGYPTHSIPSSGDSPSPSSDRDGPSLKADSLTALPEHEPSAMPLMHGRDDIVAQIEELEGTLQYVGSLHPRRDEMRQRLSGLRTLLERWEHTRSLQESLDSLRQ